MTTSTSSSPLTLDSVVSALNANKIRATYGAVAGIVGGHAIGIGRRLPERSPRYSWIVSSRNGLPTGYDPKDIHPDLPGSNLLRTADELRDLLQQH
ncbi:MAG: hypothetical protein JNK40_12040 [Chromatiales bacterium]|nr:hypothetical protein [Chromatiales bacterium]